MLRLHCQSKLDEAVLKLVLEGSWSLLEKVYKAKQNPDYLSKQGAILCLEAYLSQGSTQALPYLIKLDMNYIVKRLDNNSLTHLLKGPRDTYLKPLAKAVLLSPRKLLVRRQAAYWLYKFYSKPIPEPFDLQTSIKELIYQSSIGSPIIVSSKRLTQYQVKKGDTLWRIAKYFQLDMDQLKAHNPEINKMLIPGSFIQIPNREVDPLLQDSTDDT